MAKKKKDPIPEEVAQLQATDAAALMERVKNSNLDPVDREFVVRLIGFVLTLRALLEKRNFSLKALLRRMFGLKTERGPKDSNQPPRNRGTGGGGGAKRPGRNGRDDYPGATHITCNHQTLKPGDKCPECLGKVEESDPGVAYRWTGSPPLVLTVYLLQRLICYRCKATFTAAVPGEAAAERVHSEAPERITERKTDATANAMVAQLRYEYGVPHYRLAQLQASQGVPLPVANQWKMILSVFGAAQPVHTALEDAAAQGGLVQNDDTRMRVLSLERGHEFKTEGRQVTEDLAGGRVHTGKPAPKASTEQKGRRGITSGILSLVDDHEVVLYATGVLSAGKNLEAVLVNRNDTLAPPIQMCDALNANLPPKLETIVCNCLDHSRRKFYDVMKGFPDEVKFVLGMLGKVYKNDAEAERLGLDIEDRLSYHEEHSGPAMAELLAWAKAQLETDLCRTSGLGKAIKYMIKHWKKLTMFLHIAGAPIANSAVERMLKRAIRHRKNSLQYLNLRGAHVGDVLMSVIQTCRHNGANPFDYLTAIQRFKEHVQESPSDWLPWNYRFAMAKAATAGHPGGP